MNPAIFIALLPAARRPSRCSSPACCPGCPTPRARGGVHERNRRAGLLEIELLPGKVALRSVKCDPARHRGQQGHPWPIPTTPRRHSRRRPDPPGPTNSTTPWPPCPCTCARRLFLASVAAAPRRSSEFLDLALELYPDCAPEFAGALSDFNSQNYLTGTGPKGENSA